MDDFAKGSEESLFQEFSGSDREEWKAAAVSLLKGRPFEKAMYTRTPEGITLEPIYDLASLETVSHKDSLPGFAPFVRGSSCSGSISRPWKICQQVYSCDPVDFNRILMEDLQNGQNALNMLLDRPTMIGIDADRAEISSVGVRGVSISTVDDLKAAFEGIVFDAMPVHMNTGNNPAPLTAMLLAYLRGSGTDVSNLHGVMGYDPLGQLAEHGSVGMSIEDALDLMSRVLSWFSGSGSDVRTILIEGHPYHNGGADAVTELAYMMATGTFYLREMINRGHTVEEAASRMAFSLSLGQNFFMEISKVRAARMLWNRIVEEFGGDENTRRAYIHGKTSSWTKTVFDPYVGLLRNASEAFSGAMGGADSLTVIPFDEAIREADSFSRRISRNVQSILQEECHFTQPVDPAGGSWYVESLTEKVAGEAWKAFQKIEAMGGMNAAILDGTVSDTVEKKYEERFRDIAKRKSVWVGVNMYANTSEERLEAKPVDREQLLNRRVNAVSEFRASRSGYSLPLRANSLNELMEAAESGATLQDLYGLTSGSAEKPEAATPVKRQRGAERFENLREETLKMAKSGMHTSVLLLNIGSLPNHKPRADFTRGFFEVGGFKILSGKGSGTIEELVEAALDTSARIAVFCGSDKDYPEMVPGAAESIRKKRPDLKLIVAGRPAEDMEQVYTKAGIDHYIYLGSNCYDLLKTLQEGIKSNG